MIPRFIKIDDGKRSYYRNVDTITRFEYAEEPQPPRGALETIQAEANRPQAVIRLTIGFGAEKEVIMVFGNEADRIFRELAGETTPRTARSRKTGVLGSPVENH